MPTRADILCFSRVDTEAAAMGWTGDPNLRRVGGVVRIKSRSTQRGLIFFACPRVDTEAAAMGRTGDPNLRRVGWPELNQGQPPGADHAYAVLLLARPFIHDYFSLRLGKSLICCEYFFEKTPYARGFCVY